LIFSYIVRNSAIVHKLYKQRSLYLKISNKYSVLFIYFFIEINK